MTEEESPLFKSIKEELEWRRVESKETSLTIAEQRAEIDVLRAALEAKDVSIEGFPGTDMDV